MRFIISQKGRDLLTQIKTKQVSFAKGKNDR